MSEALQGPRSDVGWAATAAVFAIALLTRLPILDHAPTFDELYHLLAARSWAAEGTLAIGDGVYTRDAFFTRSIGALYRAFGESLVVARIIPLLTGALLVAAFFAWVRRVAGSTVAWVSALLFCFAPLTLFLAGFVRVYALHGLAFFVGVVGVWEATRPGLEPGRRGLWAVMGALGLVAALRMQPVTVIGLAGLGVWGAWVLAAPRYDALRERGAMPWVVVALVVAAGAAFLVLANTEPGRGLWTSYRMSAAWSADRGVRFYHWVLLEKYPTLWTLLPVAAMIALVRRRAVAELAIALVAVGLVLHSFAGMKAERYIYYLTPFFFLIWGIALVAVAPAIRGLVRDGLAALHRGAAPLRAEPSGGAVGVVVAAVFGFLVASNPAFIMAGRMVVGQAAYVEAGPPFRLAASQAWQDATPRLADALRQSEIVVTTNGLKTLYEFGRYDIEFSETRISDSADEGHEFMVDERTGRVLISEAPSLARVLDCGPGLFVSARGAYRLLAPEVRELLMGRARPVPVPVTSGVVAFEWSNASPGGCAALGL